VDLFREETVYCETRSTTYASLGCFFFVGFRYRVGCDWAGYLNIFELARHYETPANATEQSFWIVNRLLHYFDLEYPFINVIASGVFFLGLDGLARRQPDRFGVLILAFPILILNLAMSGIRQGIALGFLCFAYNAFVDMRLVRYVLFVAIASTFHSSAAAFLMLAPAVRGEYSPRRVALAGLLALPGLYYMLTSQAYEIYARRYIGTATEAFGAPFRTALIALTGITFLWFLDRKWKALYTSDYKLVKLSSYLMVAVFPLSFLSSVGGDRFGYYLSPIQFIILTRLPFMVEGPYSTIVAFAPYAIGGLTLLAWIWLSSLFAVCYLPYQMWW
jgi:hypothetical protein